MEDHTARQSQRLSRRLAPGRASGLIVLTLSILLAFSGCRAYLEPIIYNEAIDETFVSVQNYLHARSAWNAREHCFEEQPHLYDFRAGFYRGYQDVASGKDGCTPLFPPRRYWNWYNRNAKGYARIQAWFAGYPHGVIAAREEGAGLYTTIPTEPAITRAITEHLEPNPAQQYPPPPPVMELPPVEEVGPKLPEALPEPSSQFPQGRPLPDPEVPQEEAPPATHGEGEIVQRKGSAGPKHIPVEPQPFTAVENFAQAEPKPYRIKLTAGEESPESGVKLANLVIEQPAIKNSAPTQKPTQTTKQDKTEKTKQKNTERRGIRIRVVRDIQPSDTESSPGVQE